MLPSNGTDMPTWMPNSSVFEAGNGRRQRRTATGFMAIVGNSDAFDCVARLAFDDSAIAMDRTAAFVADTRNSSAGYRKVSGCDFDNFATVTGWIIKTNDLRHRGLPDLLIAYGSPIRLLGALLARRRMRLASIQLPIAVPSGCRTIFATALTHLRARQEALTPRL
jgi:hypothetical protein